MDQLNKITVKKYKKLYKQINNTCMNDLSSINKSCEKNNVSPSTYYKICRTFGYKTIREKNEPKTKETEKKKHYSRSKREKSSKKKDQFAMKGGSMYTVPENEIPTSTLNNSIINDENLDYMTNKNMLNKDIDKNERRKQTKEKLKTTLEYASNI
jgi:hypothetical protein